MSIEKLVNYAVSNSYSTLNDLTPKTRRVWMVFHGMGYLSRYCIRHFKDLDPRENYIIAPQAASKYYQGTDYKHVGASWLTREDTDRETTNVLTYVEAVWQQEIEESQLELVVLGYSQGVSIATRWLSYYQRPCDHLIIHSGGLPKEMTSESFNYLPEQTQVHYVYGTSDPYINDSRLLEESERARMLFGERVIVSPFEGDHRVDEQFINKLA